MQNAKRLCEKGFWLLLIASPLLDIINGILTYVRAGGSGGMLSSLDLAAGTSANFSFTVRMIFLILMVIYIFLRCNWKAVITFGAIAVTWALSLLYQYTRGVEMNLWADIQYIVRFCYCLLALIIYGMVFHADAQPNTLQIRVDRVLCSSLILLSLGILVPYILGMGFYTYADPLGYRGSRGFFYAGNDITVLMMLLLPIVFSVWLEQTDLRRNRISWFYAAAAALGLVSQLIIGTKTSFLAVGGTLSILGIYALCTGIFRKQWSQLLRYAIVLVLTALLFLLLTLVCETGPAQTIGSSISATQNYTDIAGAETVIFSGRTATLKSAFADFKAALPWSALVGIGRGSQTKIIEMDLIEVVFYYGILGTITMLWLYVKQGVHIVIDLFRNFSLRALACFVSLGLGVGFLAMAGHTLFSVTGGFYFAFLIVYARRFFSQTGPDTIIL